MEPILVIMAAGMGSRYGGPKQIDPITSEGDIIMDFSLYDAYQAGFRRVAFIIKKDFEEALRLTSRGELESCLKLTMRFRTFMICQKTILFQKAELSLGVLVTLSLHQEIISMHLSLLLTQMTTMVRKHLRRYINSSANPLMLLITAWSASRLRIHSLQMVQLLADSVRLQMDIYQISKSIRMLCVRQTV